MPAVNQVECNPTFDFELTADEMNTIRAMDTGKGSHNPDAPGVGENLLRNYKIHD